MNTLSKEYMHQLQNQDLHKQHHSFDQLLYHLLFHKSQYQLDPILNSNVFIITLLAYVETASFEGPAKNKLLLHTQILYPATSVLTIKGKLSSYKHETKMIVFTSSE